MTIRTAALGGVTALAMLLASVGCEVQYPWDVEVPQAGDSVRDLGCGAFLSGDMQWNRLDGDVYPGEWDEICHIRWELAGTLTQDFDPSVCEGCRCVYDVVATVIHDGCEWYGNGTEHTMQLGLAPTMSGPEDYQSWAADWPWIAYSNFTPSWDDLQFCYLGREDDDALPEDFDASELYLYSYWYWTFSESTDVMKLQAWVGMSD
jgi:hypothetical protein